LEFAISAGSRLTSAHRGEWLETMKAEVDNLRAALQWARDSHITTLSLRLAGSLYWFWYFLGLLTEARGWLEAALASVEADDLALARDRARVLWSAGSIAWLQGDYPVAQALAEASAAISRRIGDRQRLAYALLWLGLAVRDQGDPAAARPTLEASVTGFREMGDTWSLALALVCLGRTVLMAGDPGASRPMLEEGAERFQALGDIWGQALACSNLALTALQQKAYDLAAALYRQSLGLFWQDGDQVLMGRSLEELAWLAHKRGDSDRAASLLGMAEALRQAIGAQLHTSARAEHEAVVAGVRGQLGNEVFARAWADGRAMPVEEAVEFALEGSA
jgi:tetratricopeptide (TPR) repeat protein